MTMPMKLRQSLQEQHGQKRVQSDRAEKYCSPPKYRTISCMMTIVMQCCPRVANPNNKVYIAVHPVIGMGWTAPGPGRNAHIKGRLVVYNMHALTA